MWQIKCFSTTHVVYIVIPSMWCITYRVQVMVYLPYRPTGHDLQRLAGYWLQSCSKTHIIHLRVVFTIVTHICIIKKIALSHSSHITLAHLFLALVIDTWCTVVACWNVILSQEFKMLTGVRLSSTLAHWVSPTPQVCMVGGSNPSLISMSFHLGLSTFKPGITSQSSLRVEHTPLIIFTTVYKYGTDMFLLKNTRCWWWQFGSQRAMRR